MQCTATAHRTGERCRRSATAGCSVCQVHGAGSARVKAAGQRRLKEQAAKEAVAQYGLPVDIDPGQALLLEVRRTQGAVQFLEGKVRGLSDEAIVVQVDQRTTHGGAGTKKSVSVRAGASVWVELLQRERAHLVQVTSAALRAGVEERQLQLQAREGALLVGVVDEILDGLDLDVEQLAAAATVVPRALRRADSGEEYVRPSGQSQPRPPRRKLVEDAVTAALRRAGLNLDDPRVAWARDSALAEAAGEPAPAPPPVAVAALEPARRVDVGGQVRAAVNDGGEVVDAELVDEPEPPAAPESPADPESPSVPVSPSSPGVVRGPRAPWEAGARPGWGARRGDRWG